MGKRSGFTRFILLLLVGMSGSAAAVARERAVTTAWENESTEALCFPTENGTPEILEPFPAEVGSQHAAQLASFVVDPEADIDEAHRLAGGVR